MNNGAFFPEDDTAPVIVPCAILPTAPGGRMRNQRQHVLVTRCPMCTVAKTPANTGVSRTEPTGLAIYCRDCASVKRKQIYQRKKARR